MRWFLTAVFLILAGCGGEPDDPAEQVRAWLGRAEFAVEARSVKQAADLISPQYHDGKSNDKRTLVRILLGYYHRHQTIHLFTRMDEPSVSPNGDSAKVTVHVAMAGVPVVSAEALFSIKADFHRFDLKLVNSEGDWLLSSAAWHRARPEDLIGP